MTDEKFVEEKIEVIEEENPITPIDNNAVGGTVEFNPSPAEPEVEKGDDEMTPSEKSDFKEFEDAMDKILEEAEPELEADINPTDQLSEVSERAVEIGGYNPEQEEGKSKLVEEVLEMAEPKQAEYVADKIIDAADTALSATPEEYNFDKQEVLIEREDDKEEQIIDKVDGLTEINSTGHITEGEVVRSTEKDSDGETVVTAEFKGTESDALEQIEKEVNEMIVNLEEESDMYNAPEKIDIDGQEPGETHEDGEVNPNAQVGQIHVQGVSVITEDGQTDEDIDVTIPSISETPLDDVETGEVIHLHTLDDAEVEKTVEDEVKAMLGSESEDIDLNLGVVNGTQIVDKDAPDSNGDIIVGDPETVVMAVVAEGNKDVDGEALEEFEVSAGDHDENVPNVEIDKTNDIESDQGSPIIEETNFDDNYAEAFDKYINDEQHDGYMEDLSKLDYEEE